VIVRVSVVLKRTVVGLSSVIGRFRSDYCKANWAVFGPSIVGKIKSVC